METLKFYMWCARARIFSYLLIFSGLYALAVKDTQYVVRFVLIYSLKGKN